MKITEPPYQWTPGYGTITPGRSVRLWGREHAPYELARTKGPRRGTAEVSCHVETVDGGHHYRIYAHRKDNRHNEEPMPTLHGHAFHTPEAAYRALFDAGWIVFEETLMVGTTGPYVPPWGKRAPGDAADDGWDDPARADGAAADMVYREGAGR